LWGLLTVQLALALVLLAAGALMVNSLVRLVTFPLGFDPRAVVILDYRQPARRDIARVAASKEEQRSGVAVLSAVQRQAATLNAEIVRRVGSMPGVESATVANRVPVVGGRSRTSVEIEGRDRSLPPFTADTRSVSPGYFSTLRLRLVRGRSLNERDREGAPRVVLVNETMARTAWPGEEPVGKRLAVNGARAMVVGLIADVHHHGARDDVPPEVYSSDLQSPRDWSTLVVRGVGGQPPTEDALIASLKATEPSIQTGRFRSLEEAGAELRAGERFAAALLGGVAVLGLTLVLVGVHGVVSYLVQQRKREIAIRMALGAAPSRVIREVVGSALPYTAVGVTMGLALAWQGGSLLRTLVFGVTATDTTTLLTVSGLLVGAVVAAAYRPARRVANADPLCTLRDD
jgi:predicted permease